MSSRYPILIRCIQILALLVVLLGVFFPDLLLQIELIIAVSLIVLIGIPHGATDYIIFQYLSKPFWGTESLFYFYRNYLLIMGAYALLWWFSPTLSLIVFILLSIYHFGQSNWNFLEKISKVLKHFLFIIWGSFVLLTPILAHYEQAQPIIAQILGFGPIAIDEGWRYAIIAILFAHSVLFCLYLRFEGKINKIEVRNEVLNLFLLLTVYLFTPLLLGFAIYFVLWHSLGSVMDQISFFKTRMKNYNWKQYVFHAFPLTIMALGGLLGLILLQQKMGINANLGVMFVFISVVTLPHMLLIDKLYEEWNVPSV